jgi:hypothetical protein
MDASPAGTTRRNMMDSKNKKSSLDGAAIDAMAVALAFRDNAPAAGRH